MPGLGTSLHSALQPGEKPADTSRVTKTLEPSHAAAPSTKDEGRLVRQVRRTQGLSRAEVARSAGLTRRELAAYERGRVAIPDNDLWCLAGSCGVDVHEFIPARGPLERGPSFASLAPGDNPRPSGSAAPADGLLPGYRSMVTELRAVQPGQAVPLHPADLAALADALGGNPQTIETRLIQLTGVSPDEAARLREMILQPLTVPAAAPAAGNSGYRSLGALDPQSPGSPQASVVDFFSAPRAQDPFSPQPSPVAMPEPAPTLPPAPALAPALASAAAPAVAWTAPAPAPVAHAPAPAPPAPPAPPVAWTAPASVAYAPAPAVAPSEVHAPATAAPAASAGTHWQSGGLFPASSVASDGGLAHRHADIRWAFSDLVASGDVTIEAVLEFRAGAGFGVLFRASSDEDQHVAGYSFDLDPTTNRFLVRQWADSRAHWRPIAEAPATDPSRLFGHRTITLALQGDRLTASVDNVPVLIVPALSQASVDLGREPCRGGGLGMHAGPTTVLTVEAFRATHS